MANWLAHLMVVCGLFCKLCKGGKKSMWLGLSNCLTLQAFKVSISILVWAWLPPKKFVLRGVSGQSNLNKSNKINLHSTSNWWFGPKNRSKLSHQKLSLDPPVREGAKMKGVKTNKDEELSPRKECVANGSGNDWSLFFHLLPTKFCDCFQLGFLLLLVLWGDEVVQDGWRKREFQDYYCGEVVEDLPHFLTIFNRWASFLV